MDTQRHHNALRYLPLLAVLGLALCVASPAMAVPAFARKYHTSCTTCHTIYPKLNPFGEAFRRNGFRFPGVDSDYWQGKTVAIGQEAYKKTFPKTIWPSSLPAYVPIAVGFNGAAVIHPDKNSSAAQADNGVIFNMDNLVEEGHIWAGGSFDDQDTFFGELTIGPDGAEVEHALVLLNDIAGPKHAFNLQFGKGLAHLSSFGGHSSYLADMAMPAVAVTGLYGAQSDPWTFNDNYGDVEANGVLAGRFDYAVGLQAGVNTDYRPTENFYAHVGYKLGGMRLDGEKAAAPSNPMRPWEENAVTLDLFAYHSNSRYTDIGGNDVQDTALTLGAGLRGQYGSLELDVGGYMENHNRASDTGSAVSAIVQYDELSYVIFPWLVPAIRVEYVSVTPDGGTATSLLRIMPGVEVALRANLKLSLTGYLEQASGTPRGGWDAAGGSIDTGGATAALGPEIESLELGVAWAF